MAAASVKLKRAVLKRPAAEGIRAVARELLGDARRASDSLRATPTPGAVHSFRVALRRLRSWLRAFEPELARSVRKKDTRALRDVAHATSQARDVDVQLAMLRRASRGGGLRGRKRRKGADWLVEDLSVRQARTGEPIDANRIAEFDVVARRLAERLEGKAAERRKQRRTNATLASALASRLPYHADALMSALEEVRSPLDEKPAHRARIAVKRLRYLAEPAAKFVKKGREMITTLKTMQDELGALHDLHVLGDQIASAMEHAEAARAARVSAKALGRKVPGGAVRARLAEAPRGGLLAVAKYVRSETRSQYRVVRKHWLRGRMTRLRRDVTVFARRLDDAGRS